MAQRSKRLARICQVIWSLSCNWSPNSVMQWSVHSTTMMCSPFLLQNMAKALFFNSAVAASIERKEPQTVLVVCLLKCIIADQKHGYSSSFLSGYIGRRVSCCHIEVLQSFSLIREHPRKRFKLSVSLACYRQIGSKSTNHIPLAWRKEGQKVTIVAVIGGFRSDLSITPKTDGSFGDVSSSVLFSKVAYQRSGKDNLQHVQ